MTALGLVVGANTIKLRTTDTHGATNVGSGTLTLLADGAACSDGSSCTTGEACAAGACTGGSVTLPGELQNARFTDGSTLVWDTIPDSPHYDVVRGSLSALRASAGSFPSSSPVCVENDGQDLLTDVAQTPAAGQAIYILARAVECNGTVGTWNDAGTTSRDAGLSGICP